MGRLLGRLRAAPAAIALVVFLAAGTWLFSDAVLGGKHLTPDAVLYSLPPFKAHTPPNFVPPTERALDDITYIFHPLVHHARAAIRSGELPTWDPHIAAGRPIGAQQGAQFFPLTWPSYLLPFEDSFVVVALLKMLVAALGTYLFCRRLRLTAAPATLAGFAFAFGNPFVLHLGHGHTNAFALLPWLLLLADRLVERATVANALLLGGVAGVSFYGGHPESWATAGLIATAYLVFKLALARRRGLGTPDVLRRGAAIGGAGLVAVCVGGLVLLPLLEIVGQAIHVSRVSTTADSLKDLAVGPIAPEFWGRYDKHVFNELNRVSATYQGRSYLGALPLLFALVTIGIRARAERWFFVGLAGFSLLVMVETPVRTVAKHLPGLDSITLHVFIWPLTLSGAILAGFGLQWLLDAPPAARRRFLLGAAGVALFATAALIASRPGMLGSLGAALHQFPTLRGETESADAAALGAVLRFAVLAAVGLGLGAVALLRRGSPAAFGAIAVAVTVADLVTLGRGFFPAQSAEVAFPRATPSIELVRRAGPEVRVAGQSPALLPNLGTEYGIADARVQDLPELRRYTRLFGALGGVPLPVFGRTILAPGTPPTSPLLDVFGVRYLIDAGEAPIRDPRTRVLYARPGDRLLENPAAFPRAWVAYGWRPQDGFEAALRAASAAPASLLRSPVIEGAPPPPRAPPSPVTPARMTRSEDTSVELRVTARRAGYLVLNDTYYPGWTARVDGKPATIRPANAAFRAVAVPAGSHRVRFDYEPDSVRVGLVLALVGVALAAVGTAVDVARRRRRERASPGRR